MSSQAVRRSSTGSQRAVLTTVGVWLLFVALIGFLITFLGNWYTGTTLRVSYVSWVAIAAMTLIVSSLTAIELYRFTHVYPRWWSLWPEVRERRPAIWLARVAGSSLLAGCAAGIALYYYALLIAPYPSGRIVDVPGTVQGFTETSSRTRVCLMLVTLDLDSGQRETACFERSLRSHIAIGPRDLRPGDRVIVRQKENIFGTSIVSIDAIR